MANRFDFELTANDKATESINRINEAVDNLIPKLDQTPEKLKLGGQQSIDGLLNINTQFDNLTKGARQSVQFIGDIVPPLKMVTNLSMGLGGAAAVVNQVWKGVKDFGETGYHINSLSKNISQTTDAFQKLTGAMIENGASRDDSINSIVGVYDRANSALSGEDGVFSALLAQQGIYISKTKDGVADVNKLMDDISARMQKMNGAQQALFVKKLGGSDDLLNYLRLSANEIQRLKDQAQRDGLIFSDKDIQNALEFRKQMNQVSASWDGMMMRGQAFLGQMDLVKSSVDQVKQIAMHGFDAVTVGGIMTWNKGGNQADKLRRAQADEEFKKTLSFKEKMDLRLGYMSPELDKKIDARYLPTDKASDFGTDVQALHVADPVTAPPINPVVDPNARSVRNNNPWNLNYGRQSGATLEQGANEPRFARFPTPEAGVLAADRQLQLYYSGKSEAAHHRPLQTLTDIISTASPHLDGNNTEGMINGASGELGLDKDAPLNLTDPSLRARVLAAIFRQEGNSTYTPEKILQVIGKTDTQPQYNEQQAADAPQVRPPEPPKENSIGGGGKEQGPTIIPGKRENINQQHQSVNGSDQIAKAISDALKDNKMQIELTLINSKTGEKRVVAVQGPKVAASMDMN